MSVFGLNSTRTSQRPIAWPVTVVWVQAVVLSSPVQMTEEARGQAGPLTWKKTGSSTLSIEPI